MQAQRITTGRQVSALSWDGDDLVDFSNGPTRWSPDGTADSPQIFHVFAGSFDHAVASPSGRFDVLYAERGTKALFLSGGELLRELDRSYYHAEDFDFPVALGTLPDGREVVVHCPNEYNVLQIDDAETGRRITEGSRTPQDVFHSRLSISPDGRYLLAAGWVWQPYGIAMIFDLAAAVKDPTVLDGLGLLPAVMCDAEVESACWLDSDRVAIAASNEDGDAEPDTLAPGQLGIWSVSSARWLSRSPLSHPVGTMIACGERIVSLYGHPRLIDPTSGRTLIEWPDVDAGRKSGSYGVTHVPTPVAVAHPDGTRLAIAQTDHIAVLKLEP
ncbi:hypothetical protein GFY24_29515 [Nocardia sp. SYP-A9097]|uniref:hypothetical protein n=1 Tax=Nocardia sp. SYP-A9097 TaxID=2663237 RepID=UPI00129B886A|nr:hypothetical protein [Nocardia sp. SYP-A9097]MRH91531.1 hypothetical protein [Nocardia sp. SYP-A9097]